MEASQITPGEIVPASRKLQAEDAAALLGKVNKLIAIKGKKIVEFELKGAVPADAVEAMLGPTGNLRAPTIRSGKMLIVGFQEQVFTDCLG